MPFCRKYGEWFKASQFNPMERNCPIHKIRAKMEDLEGAADASGNPVVWQPGMPLENLPEGMRKRVEMALQFGI